MKKVISLALALALLTSASISAFADSNIINQDSSNFCYFSVEYNAVPTYTVVIPAEVNLNTESVSKQIKIYGADEYSKVTIDKSTSIAVGLSNSKNNLKVLNEDGNSISYTINNKSLVGELTIVAWCDSAEKTSTDIVFTKTDELIYSGTYSDTLTFTVSLLNKIDISTIHGSYQAYNGDFLTGTANPDTHITIADDAKVILKDCNITAIPNDTSHKSAGITLDGNGTLVIEGSNSVKGGYQDYPGVYVPINKTLTIKGSGSLNASSNGEGEEALAQGAGIGGGSKINCGNITIESGNIISTGGYRCAGIGSGYLGQCGNIVISGGNITANGGMNSGGIGSGGYHASCGNIIISNGNVTSNGLNNGAGIGTGNEYSVCGEIDISGGVVTATGGSYGAGIGSGKDNSSCGDIKILGGSVNAKSGQLAAAIGGGENSNCSNITVKNSVTVVEVTKGSGAENYIGAGNSGKCNGTITIEDGSNVTKK